MFGKQRAESVDNADGKFSGLEVCKKGGFHMRSLRALRIVGIGLAFAVILASGGLPGGSQSGQEGRPTPIVTLSYPDSKVACIEAQFAPDGKLISQTAKTATVAQGPSWLDIYDPVTYVVSWDAKALTILDHARCTVIRTLTLGGNLYAGAFRPDGAAFYAIDAENKRIVVLNSSDLTNPQLLTYISLPGASSPRGLAFHPNGQLAYVSDSDKDTVYVLDAVNHRLQETLHTGGQCSAYVKASNNGEWVYIADRCLSRVYAYETATKTFTPIQLPIDTGAWFIAFEPNDRFAFVSPVDPRRQTYTDKISVIDVAQKMHIGTIDLSGVGAATRTSSDASTAAAQLERFATAAYAPAGLEVIPLSEETIMLVVFPFLEGTPVRGVPLRITADAIEFLPPSMWPPIGLSRPFIGVFSKCWCREIRIEPVNPPNEPVVTFSVIQGAGGGRFPRITITVASLQARITCTSGSGNCQAKVFVSVSSTSGGFEGRMGTTSGVTPRAVSCKAPCNETRQIPITFSYTVTFGRSPNEDPAQVKINGAVTFIVDPNPSPCNRSGPFWTITVAIRDNALDRDNSDFDGDGIPNGQDNNPWDPKKG
jgi:hypothetical protein